MAVQRVEELLRRVAAALDAAGVTYALIGGNAVAAWVSTVDPEAVRATKDVDLLVRREDLAALMRALDPLDLMHVEVLGVHMFVDRQYPNPKSGVHLVIANEVIRPHHAHPAPDPSDSTRVTDFNVLSLPGLVRMKLESFRDIDRAHIRDLLSLGLITDDLVRGLPDDLRSRMQSILDTPE